MGKVTVSSAMENLRITEAQAKKLDSLDGNSNDGINVDIYTMAKIALAKKNNDEEYVKIYSDNLGKSDLSLFLQVQDIIGTAPGSVEVAEKDYPPPQYFDKNTNVDTKFHYIKYDG